MGEGRGVNNLHARRARWQNDIVERVVMLLKCAYKELLELNEVRLDML